MGSPVIQEIPTKRAEDKYFYKSCGVPELLMLGIRTTLKPACLRVEEIANRPRLIELDSVENNGRLMELYKRIKDFWVI
jgi:hypothetical protein